MEYGVRKGTHQTRKYNQIGMAFGNQLISSCTPLNFWGVEKIIYGPNDVEKTRTGVKTERRAAKVSFNRENYEALAEINKYYANDPDVIMRLYNYLATTRLDSLAIGKLLKACKGYYVKNKGELQKYGCNSHLELFCENLNAMSSQNIQDYQTGWSFLPVKLEYSSNEIYANLSFTEPVLPVTKPLKAFETYEAYLSENHREFTKQLGAIIRTYKKELWDLHKELAGQKDVMAHIDSLASRYPEFVNVKQVYSYRKESADNIVMAMITRLSDKCDIDDRADLYRKNYIGGLDREQYKAPEDVRKYDKELEQALVGSNSEMGR